MEINEYRSNLWRLMNIDLRKIKNSIKSRSDFMNTF